MTFRRTCALRHYLVIGNFEFGGNVKRLASAGVRQGKQQHVGGTRGHAVCKSEDITRP